MSHFLDPLDIRVLKDKVFLTLAPFRYESDLLGCVIEVKQGFYTDLASFPILPLVVADLPSVIHDYLYRKNSVPLVTKKQADLVFKEAMISQGYSPIIYTGMYLAVALGGGRAYHRSNVEDNAYQLKLNRSKSGGV
jgi:hypothetical protein